VRFPAWPGRLDCSAGPARRRPIGDTADFLPWPRRDRGNYDPVSIVVRPIMPACVIAVQVDLLHEEAP
jgi:hypothetical protein